MQPVPSQIPVAGQSIPIQSFGPARGASSVLFLPGFGRKPQHYELLPRLADDHGLRVVAPFLTPNNALPDPPRSFRACVALTRAVCTQLAAEGLIDASTTVVGHSTGGSIGLCLADLETPPAGVLALNPVLPVTYSVGGFLARALRITARQLTGRTGSAWRGWSLLVRHGGSQLANLLRRPEVSWALARDLGELQLQEYRLLYDTTGNRGTRFRQPCTILQADEDEFFSLPRDLRPWMGLVFERFDLRELREVRGHEWPLMHPDFAAETIASWVARRPRLAGLDDLARLTA